MAQHKYDLLTVPSERRDPPRHRPWYKERLQLKYLRSSKPSAALEGKAWTFLSEDLDDFRSGLPRESTGHGMVKKGHSDPVPLVDSQATRNYQPPRVGHHHDNSGACTLYSKMGPRRQAQWQCVQREEAHLLSHPLALFPHLEESVPAEMLEDIVGFLDPELNPSDSVAELCSSGESSHVSLPGGPEEEEEEDDGGEESQPQPGDVYCWPLSQTEEEEREQSACHRSDSDRQKSQVSAVTADLVKWVRELGGSSDTETIDETVVQGLFSSDSESRPILMAPIRVVELANVPAELRLASRAQSAYSSERHSAAGRVPRRRAATLPETMLERPRVVKSKFGAWYLPTHLWKLRPDDEPLQDPRLVALEANQTMALHSQELDHKLQELHGARSFKTFIATKKPSTAMPKFLWGVEVSESHKILPLEGRI